jgi:ABC-type antimicrobial peptide transport system permease subunit
MAAAGAAIGVLLAVAVAPVFAHELEAVNPYDGIAYIAGVLVAMAAALAASCFPSHRAGRIAPAMSLRCD